jgi:glycosyltransferase involved in cell wall biosynthesis
MRIAFLLPRVHLAGGIHIVLEHALGLSERHGHDVTIVLTRDRTFHHDYPSLENLRCLGIDEVAGDVFDLAVSTWWETVYSLPRLRSRRYAHFIQNTEDRFYATEDAAARTQAAAVLTLPIAYIATSTWLERQLRAVQPGIAVYRVLSGIDKEVFSLRSPTPPRDGEPLRIVVEGHQSVWFKGVRDALEAIGRMNEPRHLTVISGEDRPSPQAKALADVVLGRLSHEEMADVFANAHVLLKLSRVEGMFGPPLEAFHSGATAVIAPVTGHDEYAVHGRNCLIVGFDDPVGTARALDLLARDREFLQTLRSQAYDTAASWPDWRQATSRLAEVVEDIAAQDAPSSSEYARLLILETQRSLSRINPLPEHAIAPPSVIEKLRWVVEHEGPRGVISRGAKRAVSSTRRVRASAVSRPRQPKSGDEGEPRLLSRERPEALGNARLQCGDTSTEEQI